MDVITTHVGADFDALASVVAASRLYPGALPVLSGGADRNVAEFLSLHQELLDLRSLKEVAPEAVTTLVVVETQSSSRLGDLGKVALRPDVRVIVYDHHEDGSDLSPERAVVKPYGATTTILVEEIRARDLPVTPFEATLFLLGIYEDTGGLTFASTTPADADSVAWLLRQGANLDVVSGFLIRGLTPAQRSLMNDLLAHVRYHDVHGARIAITRAEASSYVDEVALLAHRLADTEGADALFVIVRMQENLLVVARARSWGIDVARVLEPLGGGGHERAASANIKGGDPAEAETVLLEGLQHVVRPRARARDLMSWPVRSVTPDTPISDVNQALARHGVGGMLVVENGEPVGVVERRDVDKAIHHQLSHAPVLAFMSRDVHPVSPDTSLRDIERLMIEERVGRVPVMHEGRIVGIITRTDVIRSLHHSMPLVHRTGAGERPADLQGDLSPGVVAGLLSERLPERVYDVLLRAGEAGDAFGIHVFTVGGFVRDLLVGVAPPLPPPTLGGKGGRSLQPTPPSFAPPILGGKGGRSLQSTPPSFAPPTLGGKGGPNLDVDLVVEGDGIDFARQLADSLHADVALHHRFGTAVLTLPDGFRVDVASTRTELYEQPAALPVVEHSSLRDDLARRDFTINAMAIQLNAYALGRLVDPFRGRRDLRAGRVRVLHNLSFVEDPTRLFRGVRFEARYGFRFAPGTERLARSAVEHHVIGRLSPARLRKEVLRTLQERDALAAIDRWDDLGLLPALWPGLRLEGATRERLQRADSVITWYNGLGCKARVEGWLVLFAILVAPLGAESASRFMETRLHLRARHQEILRAALFALPRLCAVLEQPWHGPGRLGVRASEVYWACRDLPVEALLLAVVTSGSEQARDRVALYLRELRHVRPRLSGDDLIAMGYPRGPLVGTVLREVLDRRLDDEMPSAEAETEYARERLEELTAAASG